MGVEEYLKEVKYVDATPSIYTKDNVHVADIRGWGNIINTFGRTTEQQYYEAKLFQDEIGQFICDAINEKLNRSL